VDKVKQFFTDLKAGTYKTQVKIVAGGVLVVVVAAGGLHGAADYIAGALTAYLMLNNI